MKKLLAVAFVSMLIMICLAFAQDASRSGVATGDQQSTQQERRSGINGTTDNKAGVTSDSSAPVKQSMKKQRQKQASSNKKSSAVSNKSNSTGAHDGSPNRATNPK